MAHRRQNYSMGVGESHLHAPVFRVTGMGAAATGQAPDFSAEIDKATQEYQQKYPEATAIAKGAAQGFKAGGAGGALAGGSSVMLTIGTTVAVANPIVGGALIAGALITGYVAANWDDWAGSIKDEERFPKIANSYIDLAWDIAASMGCGSRSNKTVEGWRVYLRLGELVAKTNPDVKKYGWHYAGPRDNDPNSDEGKSFRTSYGTTNVLTGIESRWEASAGEEIFSLGYATGRAGKRLKILQSCVATLSRIKFAFDALPNTQARRSAFAGMLQKYVGRETLKGMEFLGPAAPVSEFITALMDAPYNQKVEFKGFVPAGSAPPPSSSDLAGGGGGGGGGSTLLIIAAAAVGTYLIAKG